MRTVLTKRKRGLGTRLVAFKTDSGLAVVRREVKGPDRCWWDEHPAWVFDEHEADAFCAWWAEQRKNGGGR